MAKEAVLVHDMAEMIAPQARIFPLMAEKVFQAQDFIFEKTIPLAARVERAIGGIGSASLVATQKGSNVASKTVSKVTSGTFKGLGKIAWPLQLLDSKGNKQLMDGEFGAYASEMTEALFVLGELTVGGAHYVIGHPEDVVKKTAEGVKELAVSVAENPKEAAVKTATGVVSVLNYASNEIADTISYLPHKYAAETVTLGATFSNRVLGTQNVSVTQKPETVEIKRFHENNNLSVHEVYERSVGLNPIGAPKSREFYDKNGFVTSKESFLENGFCQVDIFRENKRLQTQIKDTQGTILAFEHPFYDKENPSQITQMDTVNKMTNETTKHFYKNGKLSRMVLNNPNEGIDRIQFYDDKEQLRQIEIKDKKGHLSSAFYDESGRLTQEVEIDKEKDIKNVVYYKSDGAKQIEQFNGAQNKSPYFVQMSNKEGKVTEEQDLDKQGRLEKVILYQKNGSVCANLNADKGTKTVNHFNENGKLVKIEETYPKDILKYRKVFGETITEEYYAQNGQLSHIEKIDKENKKELVETNNTLNKTLSQSGQSYTENETHLQNNINITRF